MSITSASTSLETHSLVTGNLRGESSPANHPVTGFQSDYITVARWQSHGSASIGA